MKKVRQSRAIAQQADLLARLPQASRLSVELASEKGASSWLTTLPVVELGFHLNKSEFRDGLCLRYNWPLRYLPSHCVCGQALNVEHALSCAVGGLPSQRHNHIRDLTATLLSEVASNVGVEPRLLPLSGEALPLRSANTDDQARLDIEAYGFWGSHHERAYALFDVRVFNPFARSYGTSPIGTTYRRHERAKVREYEQRVREIIILAGGHVRASAGALAVHTALIPCVCVSGIKLLFYHATNRDQVCFCRQVSTW